VVKPRAEKEIVMNIAEMRMLGRKINEANLAKAQVEFAPVSVSSNVVAAPVVKAEDLGWGKYVVAPETKVEVKPVAESAREAASSSYVIIDEVPAGPKAKKEKKAKKGIKSIIGGFIHKKDELLDSEVITAPVDQEIETPQLTREELIQSVGADVVPEVPVPEPMVSKKSKGLRAGGKKTSAADLGLDLSEVLN
jgi:hypothetical protein